MTKETNYGYMRQELKKLADEGNLRRLPQLAHDGRYVSLGEQRMLNLSSNDYLGLADDLDLRCQFLEELTPQDFIPSASSSRLMTGNFRAHRRLELELAHLYGKEEALLFNCGYHANVGILPAVADERTLILADKLVHASLIDGIRLSKCSYFRYRHNDLNHLEHLLSGQLDRYERFIIVTESVFSMDGDRTNLRALVELKRRYPGVMLYVDEAHAFGVYGPQGLGCAEEEGVTDDIDFLMGTFGKALASEGAFVVCDRTVREYLVNRMRPFIFTTALPPINAAWTRFLLQRLPGMTERRERLRGLGNMLRMAFALKGRHLPGDSQIVPIIVGASDRAVLKAEALQRHGFYVLPVRPPTVPVGTSRLRISLRADITDGEMERLIKHLQEL